MTVSDARDLRGYLAALEADHPEEVMRITEPVALDYEATALALELEKRGRSPVLWFEKVEGSPFPVIMNLYGTRRRFAHAIGVAEGSLLERWAGLDATPLAPETVETGPILDVVREGEAADLAALPIMRHFNEDGGPYLTNSIMVAKDPETGTRNASFHRMQVNGPRRLGTSLHSRRHLWGYTRKAMAMGLDRIPCAVVIGGHPAFTFGGGLWKGPVHADEYEIVGAFQGEPLKILPGRTVPVEIPAFAEIVIEGQLLLDPKEPEGPFGEFTGYASARSTNHAIEVSAILHRKDALYQSIVPGISDEHTLMIAVPQEARQIRTLRTQHPNVQAVHYPKSGACRMHCYISIKDAAPGQARNVAAAAIGDDLSLKLVVVVDDDVDVFDEAEVLWAMATRLQADRDVDILRDAMGAVLDPSNRDGTTSKMIVDATCKTRPYASRHTLPEEAVAKARALIERTG